MLFQTFKKRLRALWRKPDASSEKHATQSEYTRNAYMVIQTIEGKRSQMAQGFPLAEREAQRETLSKAGIKRIRTLESILYEPDESS